MRVERMPFTVYDIVGYLLPGAIFLFLATYYFDTSLIHQFFKLTEENSKQIEIQTFPMIVFFIFYLFFSYVFGHIISFFSSLIIEKIVVVEFGYPSDAILNGIRSNNTKTYQKEAGDSSYFLIILLAIIGFPLIIFCKFMKFVKLSDQIYNKKIKWYPYEAFRFAYNSIFNAFHERLESKDPMLRDKFQENIKNNDNKLWFDMISSYIFQNIESTSIRMNNYLTMYGFLRSSNFVMLIMSWGYAFKYYLDNKFEYIITSLVFLTLNFLLTCAFMKFYRRYTQEAIYGIAAYVIEKPNAES